MADRAVGSAYHTEATDSAYSGMTEWGYSARVDYLNPATDTRTMQEILTVLRIVADVAKVFNYSSRHALAIRSTPDNVALADWLVQQLNEPASTGTHERQAQYGDDVTRVFFAPNAKPTDLQAALARLRANGYIKKTFTVTEPGAIVVRGTAEQVKTAAQLLGM